jgi:hypothetical protein
LRPLGSCCQRFPCPCLFDRLSCRSPSTRGTHARSPRELHTPTTRGLSNGSLYLTASSALGQAVKAAARGCCGLSSILYPPSLPRPHLALRTHSHRP